MARLQEQYKSELSGEIQKKLGLKNPMEVPRITKITINMGVGEAVADKKIMEKARGDMEKIAGQRPVDWNKIWLIIGLLLSPGLLLGLIGMFTVALAGIGVAIGIIGFFLLVIGIVISVVIFRQASALDDV